MAFAQAARMRPIAGAVATLGVSDRVDFLRKTYGLLGVALVAFAALTAGILKFATATSFAFSKFAFGGSGYAWLAVLAVFMVTGMIAQRLAMSPSSRALQYLGLGIGVAAWSLLLQPLLWVLMLEFGGREMLANGGFTLQVALSAEAAHILGEAVILTLAIFGGLTATVFVTKKDFSFMRGALTIASFAFLGIIVASVIFGFHMGALWCGFGILLMAGYILYQTSLVMSYFPPTGYVAASLMLFSTVATLFWYVLNLLMEMNRR